MSSVPTPATTATTTPATAVGPRATSDPDSTIGTLQAVGHHPAGPTPPAAGRNSSLSVSSLSDNSADGHLLLQPMVVVRGSTKRSALARAQQGGSKHRGDGSYSYSRWGDADADDDVFDQDRAKKTTGEEELTVVKSPVAAVAIVEDGTSASIIADDDAATSLPTKRHMEIWERFFKNAILVTTSDSPDSAALSRQMELSKTIATIRKTSSASRSKGATSTARWPSRLSLPRYSSAMALLLLQTHDGSRGGGVADPTVASYVDDEKSDAELITAAKDIMSSSNSSSGARGHRRYCPLQCIDGTASSFALLLAALHDDVCAAEELLLHKGADPNCLDDQLRTPTHYCSKMGNVTMLALLFDNGADLEGNMKKLVKPS